MAASKKEVEVATVQYKGRDYEVCVPAIRSAKVQRAIANAERDLARSYDALDAICCGRLDEYCDTIPEEDGSTSEYGASNAALMDFVNAAAEQAVGAKN